MNTNTTTTDRQEFDAAYTLMRKLQRQGFGNPTHEECSRMVYCPVGVVFHNAGGYISLEDAQELGAYGFYQHENLEVTGYLARWPQHWFEDDDGMLTGDKFDPQ